MENQKDPLLSPEDELKAENNVLKIKLAVEHGMKMEDAPPLNPSLENQWLKNIYAFEQQYKDAKRISVYDYIGRPSFIKWDKLTTAEAKKELTRLQSIMAENAVQLDCIDEYDDLLIYRFLTEELFEHEMDDMRIPGMTYHFTYEEFYPNHDHDLRGHAKDFVKAVFKRVWDEKFDDIALSRKTTFAGKIYDRPGISSIIKAFQEVHDPLRIVSLDIREVLIADGLAGAHVRGSLALSGKKKREGDVRYDGPFSFHFVREEGYWYINEFSLPGFTGGGGIGI